MRLPPKYDLRSIVSLDQPSFAKLIVIAGVALVGLLLLSKLYESTTYSFFAFAAPPRTSSRSANGQIQSRSLPTFINIPSLQIALPIEEVSNNSVFWKSTSNTASHISQSAVPGEANNIVVYSQNTPDTFGRLTSLRRGDEIMVITKNGDTHLYTVSDLLIASPTEVDVVSSTDTETLTLYTSFGLANLQRFVVRATPNISH